VIPVIKELAGQGITVSIDTMHADVARAALENGAGIVNDVSGGMADPAMAPLLADAGVPWVLMHWRSVSADLRPHQAPEYGDVVADVRTELLRSVDAAMSAGVDPAQLIIDPGLGFAKKRRTQLVAATCAAAVGRDGDPRAGRCVPQALPRGAVCRPRRNAAGSGRPGDRHRGDLRTGRSTRGVGCARARRRGERRRDQGRRGVGGAAHG